ncbi:purine-binding chemotaxis protein CheW [Clostridium cavendishii DSM 21758]|uniref:Purine-binding chemotaxis protein CheW n=1 Tax=Clostridium cavendishii DSM 21758 TaxID=1121302 RepID=A0A1M6B4P6_9CLOT|nr:chemotaxis protein CheW [Clostridium cavendishii]SHI43742.1 purine-binding chemotaxis protein CheW [Clostridium cavendishii DSM 21758]
MQIVVFRLGDEQFAVETSRVQSIADMMKVTTVPNSPSHIEGLINLRGSIISLMDINLLLNVSHGNNDKTNVIILKVEDELVGVSVNQVDEVLEVEEKDIQKLDGDKAQACIKGIVNLDDRIVTLVDIDKLLLN